MKSVFFSGVRYAALILALCVSTAWAAEKNGVEAPPVDAVYAHFMELTKIPRPSLKEGKVRDHIRRIAEDLSLEWKVDGIGNMLVTKPASKGCEDAPVVVLQAHMDMVCVTDGRPFDFETQPIEVIEEDGWIRANGTTLGADDGMGVAMILAILQDDTITHGKLECLFTVDEEGMMSGAANLEADFLSGEFCINLDAEDYNIVNIGNAGSYLVRGVLPFSERPAPENSVFYKMTVTGGLGGHSGLQIDQGRANVNKLAGEFLNEINSAHELLLASINGGQADNAIAAELEAVVGVAKGDRTLFEEKFNAFADAQNKIFADTDPGVTFALTPADTPEHIARKEESDALLRVLAFLPDGVLAMSKKIPGAVETSSNLGVVRTGDAEFSLLSYTRSSSPEELDRIRESIGKAFAAQGMQIDAAGTMDFPPWDAQLDTRLQKVVQEAFLQQTGLTAKMIVIHAGLECGYIAEKYPAMDIISIGALQKDVHSPNERVEKASVEGTWNVLVECLNRLTQP